MDRQIEPHLKILHSSIFETLRVEKRNSRPAYVSNQSDKMKIIHYSEWETNNRRLYSPDSVPLGKESLKILSVLKH